MYVYTVDPNETTCLLWNNIGGKKKYRNIDRKSKEKRAQKALEEETLMSIEKKELNKLNVETWDWDLYMGIISSFAILVLIFAWG